MNSAAAGLVATSHRTRRRRVRAARATGGWSARRGAAGFAAFLFRRLCQRRWWRVPNSRFSKRRAVRFASAVATASYWRYPSTAADATALRIVASEELRVKDMEIA